ncbi:MAG: hypothetical protein ABIH74_00080, partial [Candidatus Omnitrophota bacterium]
MMTKNFIHSSWFKSVATGVVCLLALNDLSFALRTADPRNSDYTLSPTSRFAPVVRLEDQDGRFVPVEGEAETLKLTREFREEAGFMHLNYLIRQILEWFGSKISAKVLKSLIKEHLSDADFARFNL